MQLNLPILDEFATCKNVLIAGMGGGFDIFCGLPIYFEMRSHGLNVHLANYSFSMLAGLDGAQILGEGMIGVTAYLQARLPYFPEFYLAQWFHDKRFEDVTIWCFPKTGVRPLLANYEALIEHLSIDGILLVDGGVDSLMQGNESHVGTLVEDTITLCAVNELKQIRTRLTASVGFGAELDIAYAHVLENIAALSAMDGFLGSCSLVRQMEAYQRYEEAVLYVQGKPIQDPSVINSSVISSVQGHYGNYHLTHKTQGSPLWISPLMSIYWFFDLRSLARRNKLLTEVRRTDTVNEVLREVWRAMTKMPKRKWYQIPLT
jgi:hypothetical protein